MTLSFYKKEPVLRKSRTEEGTDHLFVPGAFTVWAIPAQAVHF
jgi:hypothetical protein